MPVVQPGQCLTFGEIRRFPEWQRLRKYFKNKQVGGIPGIYRSLKEAAQSSSVEGHCIVEVKRAAGKLKDYRSRWNTALMVVTQSEGGHRHIGIGPWFDHQNRPCYPCMVFTPLSDTTASC